MTGLFLSQARWRKSSRSGSAGTSCVEVAAVWRKSSRSGSAGTDCVEIASMLTGRLVAVRDSKNPDGPVLAFAEPEWRAFLSEIKIGDLDRPMC